MPLCIYEYVCMYGYNYAGLSEPYQDDYDFLRQYSDENSVVRSDLYPNANLSVLKALSHIFQWFTLHPGTSKEAVSEMLSMQHKFLLPKQRLTMMLIN